MSEKNLIVNVGEIKPFAFIWKFNICCHKKSATQRTHTFCEKKGITNELNYVKIKYIPHK